MSSPSGKPDGLIKVKNTFIEYDSDSPDRVFIPALRSKTIAAGELWTEKDDAYDFPPRSQTDPVSRASPRAQQKPEITVSPPPQTPSPSASPSGSSNWVVAWIDERSFKDPAKSMKDAVAEYANVDSVKCYKSTGNFLKNFERKFLVGDYLDRINMAIIVSPPNFPDLVSFFKSIQKPTVSAHKGLQAVIVFKASGPPTQGPGSVSDACPYATIFAHEWEVVLRALRQLRTVVHTS